MLLNQLPKNKMNPKKKRNKMLKNQLKPRKKKKRLLMTMMMVVFKKSNVKIHSIPYPQAKWI
jgi:hypothetical protein